MKEYRCGWAEHVGPPVQKADTCSSLSHGGFWSSVVCFMTTTFSLKIWRIFFYEESAKYRVRSLSIGTGSQETLSRAA